MLVKKNKEKLLITLIGYPIEADWFTCSRRLYLII